MDGRFHWLPALVCCLFARSDANSREFHQRSVRLPQRKLLTVKTGWVPNVLRTGWISPQAMKTGCRYRRLACLIGCTLSFAGWELDHHGRFRVLFAFLYTTGPYPLPQRLGRRVGHHFLRICSRRRNLLRAGTDVDTGCHHCLPSFADY